MFSEFFAFFSKLFQTTGPLKNKDCLPNSVIVLFISISIPLVLDSFKLNIKDSL